jgi:hypothetical protein
MASKFDLRIRAFVAAIVAGKARWDPLSQRSGEICCNGLRYFTDIDFRGLPVISEVTYHALQEVLGEPHGKQ